MIRQISQTATSAFLALFCLSIAPLLQADVTGTILGNVRGPSGAAVAGAKVVTTNMETNLSQQTVSDAAGEYRFMSLPTGTYRVEAELSGFQKFAAENIVRTVDQQRRLDITLKV